MSRSAAGRVVVLAGVALLLLAPVPSEQATIELFEKTRVSVVHVTTQARVVDVWTRNMFNIPRGTGSGFAWDDRGHVVTNNHVVEGDLRGARASERRPRGGCRARRRQPRT